MIQLELFPEPAPAVPPGTLCPLCGNRGGAQGGWPRCPFCGGTQCPASMRQTVESLVYHRAGQLPCR